MKKVKRKVQNRRNLVHRRKERMNRKVLINDQEIMNYEKVLNFELWPLAFHLEGGGSTLYWMIYSIRLIAYYFYRSLPGLSITLVVGQ